MVVIAKVSVGTFHLVSSFVLTIYELGFLDEAHLENSTDALKTAISWPY